MLRAICLGRRFSAKIFVSETFLTDETSVPAFCDRNWGHEAWSILDFAHEFVGCCPG